MSTFTGQTALVTGASSGIGAAYARELARRGADLVLVARGEDAMNALADEIRAAHGRRVEVMPVDLTAPESLDDLGSRVAAQGIEVDILVNNAGFGMHGLVAEADPGRLATLVQLNCAVVVDLARRFLPGMVARHRGTIINVASTASFQPLPHMAAYGASKAFVRSFSEALWAEAAPAGVRVVCICPGATETPFFGVVGTDAASVGKRRSPEQVVASTFRALDRRGPTVIDGAMNRLLAVSTRFMPTRLLITLAGRTLQPSR